MTLERMVKRSMAALLCATMFFAAVVATTVTSSNSAHAAVPTAGTGGGSLAVWAADPAEGEPDWGDTDIPRPGDGQGSVLDGDPVVQTVASTGFNVALTQSGRVVAWGGRNSHGQTDVPSELAGKKVTQVAAGLFHAFALTADGQVIGWGDNSREELNVPSELTGKKVIKIACADYWSAALTDDGEITVWGLGERFDAPPPVSPPSLQGRRVVDIDINYNWGLALTDDGKVTAWSNTSTSDGQDKLPEFVQGADVAQIVNGYRYGMVLTSKGEVRGWGSYHINPKDAAMLAREKIVQLAAGFDFAAALTEDGRILTWGTAGEWTREVPSIPERLQKRNFTQISAGDRQVIGISKSNRVSITSPQPNQIAPAKPVIVGTGEPGSQVSVQAGDRVLESAPVNSRGEWFLPVYGRGLDLDGTTLQATPSADTSQNRRGDPAGSWAASVADTTPASLTVSVQRGDVVAWGADLSAVPSSLKGRNVTQVAAGARHSLALTDDGKVAAWGDRGDGQIDVPAAVQGTAVTEIAAGARHSLAVTADGEVEGWGSNGVGELDVPAHALAVKQVAAGNGHSLGVMTNGAVLAWGDDSSNQLDSPADLDSTRVAKVAAGNNYSLALTAEGKVFAWGSNAGGATDVPDVLASKTVVEIAAGYQSSVAVTAQGEVVSWGDNSYGQDDAPGELADARVIGVAAGLGHSLAVTNSGKLLAWGDNSAGQITPPTIISGAFVTAVAANRYHSLAITAASEKLSISSPADGANIAARPTVVGRGLPDSEVSVTDGEDGLALGPVARVSSTGSWSVAASGSLAVGRHTLVATSTDGQTVSVSVNVVRPPKTKIVVSAVAQRVDTLHNSRKPAGRKHAER